MNSKCPLCIREEKTKLYYEDSLIWIVEDTERNGARKRILACIKRHVVNPREETKVNLITKLLEILEARFNKEFILEKIKIEKTNRSIPNHWHVHARIKW